MIVAGANETNNESAEGPTINAATAGSLVAAGENVALAENPEVNEN